MFVTGESTRLDHILTPESEVTLRRDSASVAIFGLCGFVTWKSPPTIVSTMAHKRVCALCLSKVQA